MLNRSLPPRSCSRSGARDVEVERQIEIAQIRRRAVRVVELQTADACCRDYVAVGIRRRLRIYEPIIAMTVSADTVARHKNFSGIGKTGGGASHFKYIMIGLLSANRIKKTKRGGTTSHLTGSHRQHVHSLRSVRSVYAFVFQLAGQFLGSRKRGLRWDGEAGLPGRHCIVAKSESELARRAFQVELPITRRHGAIVGHFEQRRNALVAVIIFTFNSVDRAELAVALNRVWNAIGIGVRQVRGYGNGPGPFGAFRDGGPNHRGRDHEQQDDETGKTHALFSFCEDVLLCLIRDNNGLHSGQITGVSYSYNGAVARKKAT